MQLSNTQPAKTHLKENMQEITGTHTELPVITNLAESRDQHFSPSLPEDRYLNL